MMLGVARFLTKLIAICCLVPASLLSQWTTSPLTDSASVINYGFDARVLTFDDGSSIFSHGITNSVYLTKLDSRGYRVWGQQPIVAHYNDTSDFGGGALIVSDNAGGAIVGWNDHRGATINPSTLDYYNDAWYMQRVDASGTIRWRSGGVLVVPPITGRKGGDIVTDGAGGAIFAARESGFGYPGAPNRERLFAARVNGNGEKLWEITLDSSLQASRIFFQGVVRAGRYIYINVMRYYTPTQETYLTTIIDTSGIIPVYSPWLGYHENATLNDGALFSLTANHITKINDEGDTTWSVGVPFIQDSCRLFSTWNSILPEEREGVFFLQVCNDSMYYISATGLCTRHKFLGLSSAPIHPNTIGVFSDGKGGIVWADEGGIAQRYDSLGTPLWGLSPIVYRSDPESAYFPEFWSDKNGGILATFWTTTRGLCVQHTGRFGQPGIVPVAYAQEFPHTFQLDQNFPNPFNPETHIEFYVAQKQNVSIRVYDVLGREVAILVDDVRTPGTYSAMWDARDVSSGVYFYRMQAGTFVFTKKLLLLK